MIIGTLRDRHRNFEIKVPVLTLPSLRYIVCACVCVRTAQFAPTSQSGGVEYGIWKNSVGTNTRVNIVIASHIISTTIE